LCCQVLLDAWFPLWPRVFQPAIGVLMLGAVRGPALSERSSAALLMHSAHAPTHCLTAVGAERWAAHAP